MMYPGVPYSERKKKTEGETLIAGFTVGNIAVKTVRKAITTRYGLSNLLARVRMNVPIDVLSLIS